MKYLSTKLLAVYADGSTLYDGRGARHRHRAVHRAHQQLQLLLHLRACARKFSFAYARVPTALACLMRGAVMGAVETRLIETRLSDPDFLPRSGGHCEPEHHQQGAAGRDNVAAAVAGPRPPAARQRPRGRQAPAEGFRAPTGE